MDSSSTVVSLLIILGIVGLVRYVVARPDEEHVIISLGRGLLILGVLVVVAVALMSGYHSVDEFGYITHSHETPVSLNGQWLTGEIRRCDMLTKAATNSGQPELPMLDCYTDLDSKETQHRFPVRYWGRIARNQPVIHWKCQRKEESVTCWALD